MTPSQEAASAIPDAEVRAKSIRTLEPDERNIECVTRAVLSSCPFCGTRTVILIDSYNADTGIYRSVAHCTNYRCDASLGYNARDRREAQDGAVERWSQRASRPTREKVRDEALEERIREVLDASEDGEFGYLVRISKRLFRERDTLAFALQPLAGLGGDLNERDRAAGLAFRAAFYDMPNDHVLFNDRMGKAITVGDVRAARAALRSRTSAPSRNQEAGT